MTDTKYDAGGQAFPRHYQKETEVGLADFYIAGMTLLDYFAGQALDDDINAHLPHTVLECTELAKRLGIPHTQLGSWARYEHAAAMVAEKRRREAMQ